MTVIRSVIPLLTAVMKFSRIGRKNAPVLGMLDAWADLYPHKRLALKTIELIVHDRLGAADDDHCLQRRRDRL
ncbi:hypothetical protein PMI33_00680 [Pseudomonas sp. GM67]|nr:hypothetical protein PMI33_00680 [Pseudomonas sp. GM67]